MSGFNINSSDSVTGCQGLNVNLSEIVTGYQVLIQTFPRALLDVSGESKRVRSYYWMSGFNINPFTC